MQIQDITLKPNFVLPEDPKRFVIGQPVVEGGFIVEKITYNPQHDLYNKGKEVGRPGYTIHFMGIPERRFIPEEMVGPIQLGPEPKKQQIPELPE